MLDTCSHSHVHTVFTLFLRGPTACQQDTGVSAANPVVASSFQHGQPPDTHVDAVAAIPIAPLGSEAGGFSDESTESADIQCKFTRNVTFTGRDVSLLP